MELQLCFTNGGQDLRTVRIHTSLLGGRGPGRCLEESVPAKTGKSKRANKTMPTRHLPVLPNAFDVDFTWGLPFSFPMLLEAQVRRATVTSSRRQAGVFNVAGSKCGKKLPASCNRFQAWSCDSLRHRSGSGRRTGSPIRDAVFKWHDGRQHVALPARTWSTTLCWCEQRRGVGLR